MHSRISRVSIANRLHDRLVAFRTVCVELSWIPIRQPEAARIFCRASSDGGRASIQI